MKQQLTLTRRNLLASLALGGTGLAVAQGSR
jgi:hypothetical protein